MKRLLVASAVVGATAPSPVSQQTYRFGVRVENVYVDVFVSQKGEPLAGLGVTNFEVLDNGVPQEIEIVDREALGVPLSAFLILDTSLSVRGGVLEDLKEAGRAFLEGLEGKDEAGILTFSEELQLHCSLTGNFDAIRSALERAGAGGGTGLYDAVYAGIKLVETARGRPAILLFTDGVDTISWLSDTRVVTVVNQSDAVVYVIGIQSKSGRSSATVRGDSDYAYFLRQVTEASGGQVYYAGSAAELKSVYLKVLRELKTRYLLTYQPKGASTGGWHTLEVRLKNVKAEVRARRGYFYQP